MGSEIDPTDPVQRMMLEAVAPVVIEVAEALLDAVGGMEGLAAAARQRQRWEDEHPGVPYGETCHCWCEQRGHDRGTCTGDAEQVHAFWSRMFDSMLAIPVCSGCSAALDARTDLGRASR